MTFSIVAHDPTTGALGAACQSRFLAVGAIVPWARAGVGAVVTQARARVALADTLLDDIASGRPAPEALDDLLTRERDRGVRQVGAVDHAGRVAAATGDDCAPFAAHATGDGVVALGNFLVTADVPSRMVQAFEATRGPLAPRLLAALRAGQAAGGERRGVESASLLVVCEGGGFGGDHDRAVDLRVDHDADPIGALGELLRRHELHFGEQDPAARVRLRGVVLHDVARHLRRHGWLGGSATPPTVASALREFLAWHNLEGRWVDDDHVDAAVLPALRDGLGHGPAVTGDHVSDIALGDGDR